MTLILSEKSKNVQQMFDRIAYRYDFLNRLLSARQDVRWRNELVRNLPAKKMIEIKSPSGLPSMHPAEIRPQVLVDVACGTGDVLISVMKQRHDFSKLIGVDISEGMMTAGRQRKEFRNLDGRSLSFKQGSAEDLPLEENSADAVTIAFGLRNVENREKALSEFYRVLKPGGKLLVLEFFQAENSLFARAFDFYFRRILPLIGGIFSDRASYEYLPQSVSSMPLAYEFENMLTARGFLPAIQRKWLSGATRLFVSEKPLS